MRRAAALPMVLLSLGLIAALSVGGSFVTRRFLSDGRRAQGLLEVEPALESALAAVLAGADSAALDSLAVGQTAAAATIRGEGVAIVTIVWVTRTTDRTFAIVGEVAPARNQLQFQRLMLTATLDSSGLRPIPLRPWTRLP